MKNATIRDLHLHTKDIVERVASGATIIVTRRGVAVAEMRPSGHRASQAKLPDRERFIKKLPAPRTDSGRVLEEDRS